MSQQINLFNPQFLKKKRYFSFATMVQSLGVLLLGLAAFYGYARYQETLLADEAKAASVAFEAEKARLAKFTADFAPGKAQSDTDKAIVAAKADITARHALLDQLKTGVLGNTRGYSVYLGALARRTQQGAWLTSIQIGPGDETLSIAGRALQGDQVSALLAQYRLEPVLKGRPFNGVSIVKQPPVPGGAGGGVPGFVEFRLSAGQMPKEPVEKGPADAASAAAAAGQG